MRKKRIFKIEAYTNNGKYFKPRFIRADSAVLEFTPGQRKIHFYNKKLFGKELVAIYPFEEYMVIEEINGVSDSEPIGLTNPILNR